MASSSKPTSQGKALTLEDAICLVAQQGLTPDMALRACNNPDITNSALSRELGKLVSETAKAEVARRREKSKENGAENTSDGVIGRELVVSQVSMASSSEAASASASSAGRAGRRSAGATSGGTSGGISPMRSPMSSISSGTAIAGRKRKAEAITPSFGSVQFTAPYLKRKPTHFQRKVQGKVELLMKQDPSPQKKAKTAKKVSSRKTGLQKNVQWRNELSYQRDTYRRYVDAHKEGTVLFRDLKQGKIENPKTQQEYVNDLNRKFNLDGEGREKSREKHMLNIKTLTRAVANGKIGVSPKKKGKAPEIDRDFLRLVAVHVNMEQVGVRGELDAQEIVATMTAATIGTPHEGQFNMKYAWEMCRKENAEDLIPTGVKQAEDIRWNWVTWEKLNQFLTDLKGTFLKYGFAIDEPETLPNGEVAEITMNRLLAHRNIVFDETEFRLGNDRDVGGTRSGTYTNASLNRGGARSTRSNTHVTGGLAVTAGGELLPPLIIFSSAAEKEENMAVNDAWVASFGKTRGKYGHKHHITRLPYVAVRRCGSMDVRLFMGWVETATFDLYPKETVSLTIQIDEHGRLVTGPVMWNCDTGPGRLTSVDGELGKIWDEWAEKMMNMGIILNGLLPNSTTVSAVMDELFRAFKIASRKSTQKVFARKIKANAKAVAAKKIEMAAKLARNEPISVKDRSKVNVVASLNPGDLGSIVYGKLDDDGFPEPTSPIAESFTMEKILNAWDKLGISPFTRKMLNNPKVRHELGQGEETDQTRQMRDLEKEYEELKQRCYDRGYDTTVFDATLATTTPLIRGETMEERARDLAKSGKTASAGGMFRFLGSMVYNSEEMLLARKIQRDEKDKKKRDKADKEMEEMEALYEEVNRVYAKYIDNDSNLDKLVNAELKILVKYVCKIEGKKNDAPSNYKNAKEMKDRLNKCEPSWTQYVEPLEGEDDEGNEEEAPAATNDPTDESWMNDIEEENEDEAE